MKRKKYTEQQIIKILNEAKAGVPVTGLTLWVGRIPGAGHQDHAWGDGNILQNYKCSPGMAVDKYRAGYKTLVLISLREIKHKGDTDEFNIEWDIQHGFLKRDYFWTTDITQCTNRYPSK